MSASNELSTGIVDKESIDVKRHGDKVDDAPRPSAESETVKDERGTFTIK